VGGGVRVALLTWDWPAITGGGVATLTWGLARGLTDAGARVEVWTRGGGERTRLLAAAPREDWPVVGFPGRSWRQRGPSHFRRGVSRHLDRWSPDVVIATTWDPLAGLDLDLPGLTVIAHGRDITGALNHRRSAQRAAVLASDARWLCLTDWMRAQLQARGVPAGRITRVPAAVREPATRVGRSSTPGAPVRALCVGRLIPRKGQDVAIAAMRRLAGKVQLDVVGHGPDAERLTALAGPSVRLRGRLAPDELEQAWAEADLHVMAARTEAEGDTEGFGLVYLEAAARGLPSIGARSAGAAEAIEHGRTGLLVDDPRDVDELAAAIDRLASDPELRDRLGRAAHARWATGGRPSHLGAAVLEALA